MREEARTGEQHARRKRELRVQGIEEDHETRHNERRQDDDDPDRHEGHDGRIDEGRRQRRAGFDVPLDVVGQLVQHGVEISGQLGRLENADIEVGERFRMCGGGRREGVTGAEVVDHLDE